ncbi:uncharacterized protein LOC135817143 [Sycon ciliatum]|uniref:uncharacterized protein LOC135817143 n=1 Tax=Sycon ciliatum TaxID=27933 RepID=UPI0031F70F78
MTTAETKSLYLCRATRANVVLVLLVQLVIICSLPFILPSRKAKDVFRYPTRPLIQNARESHHCSYSPCKQCSDLEMKIHEDHCDGTGYFQRVSCEENASLATSPMAPGASPTLNHTYVSCLPPWQGPPAGYLAFLFSWLASGVISLLVVRIRLRQLARAAQLRLGERLKDVVSCR